MTKRIARKRNPEGMSDATKVALALAAGIAVGGGLGYLVANTRKGEELLDDLDDDIDHWRLPDPSFAVRVPQSLEEFQILDDLVCECGAPLIEAADPSANADDVILKLRDCLAKELYPAFKWPPVPGDHPTVSQFWAELGVLARRAVVTGTICDSTTALPAGEP